jgi:hypothetical protein
LSAFGIQFFTLDTFGTPPAVHDEIGHTPRTPKDVTGIDLNSRCQVCQAICDDIYSILWYEPF